jgi:hypothetical protein
MDKKHKRAFLIYGILSFIFIVGQSVLLLRQERASDEKSGQLEGVVTNLRDQLTTLNNALKLQVTTDDIHRLEKSIQDGFKDIKDFCQQGRKSAPPTEPKTPTFPPAVVGHVLVIQRRAASQNPSAPYSIQVVLQSDVTIQPVAFRVECDYPIADAKAFIVGQGTYMMFTRQFSPDRKAFSFSFNYPPLTPDASLVVSLTSSDDIRVVKVEKDSAVVIDNSAPAPETASGTCERIKKRIEIYIA